MCFEKYLKDKAKPNDFFIDGHIAFSYTCLILVSLFLFSYFLVTPVYTLQ